MDQQELRAIGEMSVETAANWQNRANVLLTEEEKGIQEQMQRLLSHPTDKVVLTRTSGAKNRSKNAMRSSPRWPWPCGVRAAI